MFLSFKQWEKNVYNVLKENETKTHKNAQNYIRHHFPLKQACLGILEHCSHCGNPTNKSINDNVQSYWIKRFLLNTDEVFILEIK